MPYEPLIRTDGEYLFVHDSDIDFVRGHVSDLDAMAVVHTETGMDIDAPVTIRHQHARWIPDPEGEYHMLIRLCKPGRGAFKVTTVEYMG